jgi:hypothetical protein
MLFEAIVAVLAIGYTSSKLVEHTVDVFVILPGLILLGLFWALLSGGLDDSWQFVKYGVGAPLIYFMLKPKE